MGWGCDWTGHHVSHAPDARDEMDAARPSLNASLAKPTTKEKLTAANVGQAEVCQIIDGEYQPLVTRANNPVQVGFPVIVADLVVEAQKARRKWDTHAGTQNASR